MFDEADVDGNQHIDFQEFCDVMKQAQNFNASAHWGKLWSEVEREMSGSVARPRKRQRY